jgi:hypothetical protein
MSSSANCDEDIKPDVRVWCFETLSSISDSFDVKPELSDVAFDNKTSTTSSQSIEFQSSVGTSNGVEDRVGDEPHACVLCHKLYPHQPVSYCDEKLHQLPLVLMDEFDITKLIYPVISKPQASEMLFSNVMLSEELAIKPYICMECGEGHPSITQWKIHEMRHSGIKPFCCGHCHGQFWTRKQLLTHSISKCLSR